MRYDQINPHNLRHIAEVLASHADFLERAEAYSDEAQLSDDETKVVLMKGATQRIAEDLSSISTAISQHLVTNANEATALSRVLQHDVTQTQEGQTNG